MWWWGRVRLQMTRWSGGASVKRWHCTKIWSEWRSEPSGHQGEESSKQRNSQGKAPEVGVGLKWIGNVARARWVMREEERRLERRRRSQFVCVCVMEVVVVVAGWGVAGTLGSPWRPSYGLLLLLRVKWRTATRLCRVCSWSFVNSWNLKSQFISSQRTRPASEWSAQYLRRAASH